MIIEITLSDKVRVVEKKAVEITGSKKMSV